MKKYVVYIFTFIILFGTVFYINTVNAESGWDYDYDSGGGWDYGGSDYDYDYDYDYDSGGSWNSGSNWNYGSSSSNSGDVIAPFIIALITIIIIYLVLSRKLNRGTKYRTYNYNYNSNTNNHSSIYRELTIEEINQKDSTINKDEINRIAFNLYKNIQDAWMNFDYESLKKYTSDELFHMYESQLKVLELKKQKNIMSDIEFKSAKIVDITIENGIEKIKMYLNTITKDYVVDADRKIVRGSDKFKNDMEYIIILNRNIKNQNIKNCPSCGAPIDIVSGGQCPYCDSIIVNNNNEFVMSKKTCIGQRRI